ncbi:MAG: M48 family metalloprotease [Bacteroidota bacterium]
MRYLLFFFMMGSLSKLQGQFEHTYTPIQITEDLPAELLDNVRQKTLMETASQVDSLNSTDAIEFYAYSNFALNQTLWSGNVYFHDEIGQYLNRLVDYLLRDDPMLRGSIHIYATKLLSPNATCFRDGSIFLNLSLLPYLENEAQLAYILSHEISHFQLKHSLEQFKKGKELKNQEAWEENDSEKLLEILKYGREQELQADLAGLNRILLSDYDASESLQALKRLQLIDFTPSYPELDLKALFQLPELPIEPSSIYFLNKSSPLYSKADNDRQRSEEETSDSTLSTHPSIELRIEKLAEKLTNEKEIKGESFIFFDSAEFRRIQLISIFERVEKLSNRTLYVQALYLALRLAEDWPENQYLQEKAATSLFWLAYYAKQKNRDSILPPKINPAEVPFDILSNTFHYMSVEEYLDLGQAFVLHRLEKFPDSEQLMILKARMYELRSNREKSIESYHTYLQTYPSGNHAPFARHKINTYTE